MHIPDGYLSPQTCLATYAAMTPLWLVGVRRVERTLKAQHVPLLAIAAAFCFLVMMFNVPFGASSGHITGGVLAALLLGPWAAMLTMSVALAVQAFLLGDGGVTALGANCFNMAFVMPVVGYALYRLAAGRSEKKSRRRLLGAALGAYVGLNLAAGMTGLMLGLQPAIAPGQFAPYGLKTALFALLLPHLLVFGPIEAVVTVAVVAYFQRAEPELIR
jgi:cobalt/nickel transport system permease protein